MFNCEPITSFKQNKNINEFIRSNKTEKNKVQKKENTVKTGKCSPNVIPYVVTLL